MSMCSSLSDASPCCSGSPCSNTAEYYDLNNPTTYSNDFLDLDIKPVLKIEPPSPPEYSNNDKKPKSRKRKVSYERPTVCSVCGKESTCLHYGVPSCNGCKTFFRRCVTENKNYKCNYGGNCDINEGLRCRACRWNKCLEVGMDPRGVKRNMSESYNYDEVDLTIEDEKAMCSRLDHLSIRKYANFDSIETLMYAEKKLDDFRNPLLHDNFSYYYGNDIRTILLRHSELGKDIIKRELPDEMSGCSKAIAYCTHQRHHFCKNEQWDKFKNRRHWLTEDLILSMEMAKTMPKFYEIDPLDQEKLLKYVTLAVTMLTQCFYSSRTKNDTIVMPDGLMPIKLKPKGADPSPLEEQVFCRIMVAINALDLTPQEYVLLKALFFSYWATPELSEATRVMLKESWNGYAKTLMDYLKFTRGPLGGPKKYAEIVSLIETFFNVARKHKELYAMGKVFCRRGPPISNVMEEIMS